MLYPTHHSTIIKEASCNRCQLTGKCVENKENLDCSALIGASILYHVSKGSGNFLGEGAKIFSEPDVLDGFKEAMFSRDNRIDYIGTHRDYVCIRSIHKTNTPSSQTMS